MGKGSSTDEDAGRRWSAPQRNSAAIELEQMAVRLLQYSWGLKHEGLVRDLSINSYQFIDSYLSAGFYLRHLN